MRGSRWQQTMVVREMMAGGLFCLGVVKNMWKRNEDHGLQRFKPR